MDDMPVQMAKGLLLQTLESRWNDPRKGQYNKAASLYHWLRADGTNQKTLQDVGFAAIGDLTASDANHLRTDWFGANNFFVSLELPTEVVEGGTVVDLGEMVAAQQLPVTKAAAGEPAVRNGVVAALSAALGFDSRDEEALKARTIDDYRQHIASQIDSWQNRTIEMFWFCGKGSTFECMVSWSPDHVNLFIMTPPLRDAADPTLDSYPEQTARDAPKLRPRGLLYVNSAGPRKLLAVTDGGVA